MKLSCAWVAPSGSRGHDTAMKKFEWPYLVEAGSTRHYSQSNGDEWPRGSRQMKDFRSVAHAFDQVIISNDQDHAQEIVTVSTIFAPWIRGQPLGSHPRQRRLADCGKDSKGAGSPATPASIPGVASA